MPLAGSVVRPSTKGLVQVAPPPCAASLHPFLDRRRHIGTPRPGTPPANFPVLLAVAAVLAAAGHASAQVTFSGQPSRISDGDTLTVAGQRVRLFAIDAPEMSQTCWDAAGVPYPCGELAREALVEKIGGSSVTCTEENRDRFDRSVAVCILPLPDGSTLDLNDWLVRQGLAVAYTRFSGVYKEAEDEARQAKRGLWAGTFQMPWDFRNAPSPPPASPGTSAPAAAPAPLAVPPAGTPAGAPLPALAEGSACLIKGNISSAGKVYHVPGSPSYEQTVIDESRGERWFCTEEEAVAAGWRPPL